MVKRLSALLLLALCCAPLVQAQECTALVQEALELTEQLCGITERNQACYGNIAIESVPQADAANFKFDAPGDIVSVSDIQTLNLSALTSPDEWGVALLSLQADLPDTIPGQNVTVLLFGGTAIENAGAPQPATVSVSANSTINVRSGPGTSNRVLTELKPSEALTADGQNAAGDWLRVLLPDDATGWVSADLVQVEGDATTLTVVDTTTSAEGFTYAPMQAFYFSSGVGAAGCAEAPQDGILIQTPTGVGTVNLLINEVSVELGSTAYMRAQNSGQMIFDLLEGSSIISVGDQSVRVLPGTRATIPLDAEGHAAGAPELTTIPEDGLTGLEGIVGLLPEDIELPTPLTAAELEEATQGVRPEEGTWTITDTGGAVDSVCEGIIIPPITFPSISGELVHTEDGFMFTAPDVIAMFVGDGDGNFIAQVNMNGGTTRLDVTLIDPSLMRGQIVTGEASCNITWNIDMTRQE